MRKYELVLVLQPELDDNAANAIIEKARGWITEAGGSVDKVDNWGKRRMAYQIRKQREGHYYLINATLAPTACANLERNLRFTETVLRFMLTLVD
jgi:small subunit ribosomal protein S6